MDKRGIRETELWGAILWVALIVFVTLEGAWLNPWTWPWAVALIAFVGVCWLCMRQYGTAKRRAEDRRKAAVRSRILALSEEQRRDLNALAMRGEMDLSGDDAEEQIEAALRGWPPYRSIVLVASLLLAGCSSDRPRGFEASPLAKSLADRGCVTPAGSFGIESGGVCVPTLPDHMVRDVCDRQVAGEALTPAEDEVAVAHCD